MKAATNPHPKIMSEIVGTFDANFMRLQTRNCWDKLKLTV